jgi:hypothetical protein
MSNNNRSLTKAVTYSFYISPTMYVYCAYSASLIVKKQLANCLKRAETDIVLSVLVVRAYSVSFSASLDMNQVPEKWYLGQHLFIYMYSKSRFLCVFCRRIVKAPKVARALHNVFCIVTLSIVIYVGISADCCFR